MLSTYWNIHQTRILLHTPWLLSTNNHLMSSARKGHIFDANNQTNHIYYALQWQTNLSSAPQMMPIAKSSPCLLNAFPPKLKMLPKCIDISTTSKVSFLKGETGYRISLALHKRFETCWYRNIFHYQSNGKNTHCSWAVLSLRKPNNPYQSDTYLTGVSKFHKNTPCWLIKLDSIAGNQSKRKPASQLSHDVFLQKVEDSY